MKIQYFSIITQKQHLPTFQNHPFLHNQTTTTNPNYKNQIFQSKSKPHKQYPIKNQKGTLQFQYQCHKPNLQRSFFFSIKNKTPQLISNQKPKIDQKKQKVVVPCNFKTNATSRTSNNTSEIIDWW